MFGGDFCWYGGRSYGSDREIKDFYETLKLISFAGLAGVKRC